MHEQQLRHGLLKFNVIFDEDVLKCMFLNKTFFLIGLNSLCTLFLLVVVFERSVSESVQSFNIGLF